LNQALASSSSMAMMRKYTRAAAAALPVCAAA
jgi:hypothetical protein